MDRLLEQRFASLATSPATTPQAIAFVRAELAGIDPRQVLSDAEAGGFVTHVSLALGRLLRGEEPVSKPSGDAFDKVLDAHPRAPEDAANMARRIETAHGRSLPDAERQFLTIHLGLIEEYLAHHEVLARP